MEKTPTLSRKSFSIFAIAWVFILFVPFQVSAAAPELPQDLPYTHVGAGSASLGYATAIKDATGYTIIYHQGHITIRNDGQLRLYTGGGAVLVCDPDCEEQNPPGEYSNTPNLSAYGGCSDIYTNDPAPVDWASEGASTCFEETDWAPEDEDPPVDPGDSEEVVAAITALQNELVPRLEAVEDNTYLTAAWISFSWVLIGAFWFVSFVWRVFTRLAY
ncbi:MAG: hypothetical protein WDN67_05160 [Candidatus Moraniibacteriota bacterium]